MSLADRKAKIVATLGPSSQDETTVQALIEAGVDVARLNFSHGTHADHAARIRLLRRLSTELHKPISILQDLQGPKMRVGTLPQGGILLNAGEQVILCPGEYDLATPSPSQHAVIPLDVPEFARSVRPGNRILLDDGQLELEVVASAEDRVTARVTLGGKLTSNKGVNLPGSALHFPGFTDKDRQDLQFGISEGVDWVAISFVRTPEDVLTVRSAIAEFSAARRSTPIIAKLERPEAIENLEAILQVADGVMVARGDLGVETSPSSVPIVQKKIIHAANSQAKTVITATQMLDSMIHNPRPTRAEASDVANAIFDGSDAVMLSGETASGAYPLESVRMMASIICEAEAHFSEWGSQHILLEEATRDDAVTLVRAARELAHDRNVAAIAVFTQSGRTANLMSKARPRVPILAFTPEITTFNRLGLLWGVTPFFVPNASTVEGMIAHVDAAILSSTDILPGLQVVVITGFPVGTLIPPNLALLHTIE